MLRPHLVPTAISRRPLLGGCAVAMFLALAPVLSAQAGTKPWTLDELLALRQVTDPQICPDGRWVAYVVSELNSDKTEYQTDIWIAPTSAHAGTPAEARRITTSPQVDESPRWSPDGRTLAFLSERPRPGITAEAATEEAKRQLWMIRPDGGEAWMVSNAKGGVSSFEWSRDGKRIAYLSREPKTDARRKAEKEKDDAYTPSMMYAWNRLWIMDVASKKATQLTSGEFHVSAFSIAPDGERIVVAAQPTPLIPDRFKSDLYVVPTRGGKPAPLVTWKGADEQPVWSPDGRWIAFMSQAGKTTEWYVNNHVCIVPAAGGTPKNITSGYDQRVSTIGLGDLLWSPDGASVLFISGQRTANHIFRAFADGRPVEQLTTGDGFNASPSIDRLGDALVFLSEDGAHLRDIYRASMPGGAAERVTDVNPDAVAFLSFPKRVVSWKSTDGMPMEGLLIEPPGHRAGQRVPLLVNVHGGPAGVNANTCTVGSSRLYPLALFAQKGFAILLPNPRGSDGYGGAFRAANVRDWGGRDFDDIMTGVDALIAQSIADPNRLAVCGWSYGGFMTSTIVTKTGRFRAAVVGAGVVDLMSMAVTCDIPEFNRSYFQSWPWDDAQFYVDHSAMMHANHVTTPTMIVHGGADDRVPTSQGYEFYNALKRVGVPTELLLLPRQPHGPREPKLLRSCAQAHLDWIEKYTLGPDLRPAASRANARTVEARAAGATSATSH
jgi:dipeptidyl aminopeptidase/acylaminoacyl peptidase